MIQCRFILQRLSEGVASKGTCRKRVERQSCVIVAEWVGSLVLWLPAVEKAHEQSEKEQTLIKKNPVTYRQDAFGGRQRCICLHSAPANMKKLVVEVDLFNIAAST